MTKRKGATKPKGTTSSGPTVKQLAAVGIDPVTGKLTSTAYANKLRDEVNTYAETMGFPAHFFRGDEIKFGLAAYVIQLYAHAQARAEEAPEPSEEQPEAPATFQEYIEGLSDLEALTKLRDDLDNNLMKVNLMLGQVNERMFQVEKAQEETEDEGTIEEGA